MSTIRPGVRITVIQCRLFSLGSDHFPIKIAFSDSVPSFFASPRLKFQTANADSAKYSSFLHEEVSPLSSLNVNNISVVYEGVQKCHTVQQVHHYKK